MPSIPATRYDDDNIAALTGLRAIAASLVFFYHWFFTHASHLPFLVRAPFDVGYVGVPIFFALSGFLISIRYTRAFAEHKISYRQYCLNRFARIYPLYAFVLTAFAVIPQKGINLTDISAIAVAYTLTQALFPGLLLAGVAVGWTLTLEFLFYICAPSILAWLNAANGKLQLLGRALILSGLAIVSAWIISMLPIPGILPGTLLGAPIEYVLHYSIFGHLPDFIVGMVVGLLFLRRDSILMAAHTTHWLIGIGLAGSYLCMIALGAIASELGSPLNRLFAFGIALFSSALILGLAFDKMKSNPISKWLGARWMVYLGLISYALYLIQLTEPCQWLYWVLLGETFGIRDQVVRAILLYGLASLLAAILYHTVERPTHQWFHRFSKRTSLTKAQHAN